MGREKLDFRMYRGYDEKLSLTDCIKSNQIIYSMVTNKVLYRLSDDNTFILATLKYLTEDDLINIGKEIHVLGLTDDIIGTLSMNTIDGVIYNMNEVIYATNESDFAKLKRERRLIK